MTQAEHLEEILKTTGLEVAHYEYEGADEKYIVYNEITEKPTNYADNAPRNKKSWWQVHLFTSKDTDFREIRSSIEKMLMKAGFKVTEIKTLYEKETRTIHVVIYCNMGEREE